MTNLDIWNKLGKTDPNHTKGFKRAGGFGGTAIKPIYTTMKMTEQFGPAGLGWGMGEPVFTVVPGSEGQVAVYCTVSLWWDTKGFPCTVYGVGGDMVVVKQSSGLRTDDEAFKKAFTDALGNAMKHIGMSADVHMGLFEDNKYVSDLKAEIAATERPADAPFTPQPDNAAPRPKAQSRPMYAEMQAEIDACSNIEDLVLLWGSPSFQFELKRQPADWQIELTERKDQLKASLQSAAGMRV